VSSSTQLVDKVSGMLASRFSRRGFFARSAVVGSAIAANPVTYALTPTKAYAAVCNCSGSNCDCGSTCCDGYTEFCCTLSGRNQCPPGSLLGGWWKVDGSGFCNGPRYYMDCNSPCNGCGCGGNGICAGACSGTGCGCANGDCGNRKAGCTNFRYGQCNQQIACIGPIICRVVTCIAPWEIDGTCTTTARYDAATAFHDRPCLHAVDGDLNSAEETSANGRPAIRVTGWAVDYDAKGPIDVHVYLDGRYAASARADRNRPDVAAAVPGMGPSHGYDVTIPASPGAHNVCVYGINVGPSGNGNPALGCRSVRVGSPFGNLEGYSTGPGNVTLKGWAIDPDTTRAVQIHVYVDGSYAGAGTANRSRPDVGDAYPGSGDNHGFEVTVPISPGSHQVCAYAINIANGSTNPQLGCFSVVAGVPVGSLDSVVPTAGGVIATGWAFDPDQPTSPIQVRIQVDGANAATTTANLNRPDVAKAHPSAGPAHGYSLTVPASPGVHTVRAVAVNVGPGSNRVLASRRVEVRSGTPFGNIDRVVSGPGRIRVSGWILDPDTTGTIGLRVDIDGVPAATSTTDVDRPDIRAVYPGYGSVHGFEVTVPATNGLRTVRVVGINVGAGANTVVGARQVLVGGNPFGNFEAAVTGFGGVVVRGWAIDPDTAGPIPVHVFIDGRKASEGLADVSRPDVAAAHPLYGADHGFDFWTGIGPGRHEVCVFAINQGPGNDNPMLGCRVVG
jgi:hypothetical protein